MPINKQQVIKRFNQVFTIDELSKIQIKDTGSQLEITVDVHGMSCWQARRFINNIINLVQESFQLEVIHGYIHGTAIRDMIAEGLINRRIINRYVDTWHYGATYLNIA